MKKYNALEEDALRFLRDSSTAVIATCLDGRPNASTIYFAIDDDFNFYYITKQNSRKNIDTAFNPLVALVVGTGPKKITIQARGNAEVLVGGDKTEALKLIASRHSDFSIEGIPINNMEALKDSPIVANKVTPTELTFMNMDCEAYPRSMSKSYHKII